MGWPERQWYRLTPLHLALIPLSLLFLLASSARRLLYRRGLLRSSRLPVPVIIVGNITVGGSGKTPLTLWLAEQLIERGWHPGIVSRGYGGSNKVPCEVHREGSASEVGDEPLLMARRNLCPVWIGRHRPAAAQALLQAHPECNVIICDDGLQHYRLQRDVEIAVVDGTRRFGNGFPLPAGPLRELPSRLDEVDAVVVNGGEAHGQGFRMQLTGTVFHNLLDPGDTRRATAFQGQKLHAIAGIGHPQRFFEHLNQLGLQVQPHPFPDHHRYNACDIAFDGADAILMTEKDAVKCAPFANEKCWVLRVDAQLDSALAQLILERITAHGSQAA